MRTIKFHYPDNDALLAYSKFDPVTGDQVLVVVTLNPFGPEEASLWLDMGALGMSPTTASGCATRSPAMNINGGNPITFALTRPRPWPMC